MGALNVLRSQLKHNTPFQIGGANAGHAANAVLMGRGTTSDPVSSSTANARFLEFICSTSAATSSDARGMYLRLHMDGSSASAGGEALRAFTVVNENIGTAHGAHISLSFDDEAGGSETSGLGVAIRGTLHIPNVASWAPTGTYAAGKFEVYSDGSSSDPAGMTNLSVLSLGNSGDTTGAADVDDDAFILDLPGWTAATGTAHAISSTSLAELPASSIGLRIRFNGNTYYIPAVIAAEWN